MKIVLIILSLFMQQQFLYAQVYSELAKICNCQLPQSGVKENSNSGAKKKNKKDVKLDEQAWADYKKCLQDCRGYISDFDNKCIERLKQDAVNYTQNMSNQSSADESLAYSNAHIAMQGCFKNDSNVFIGESFFEFNKSKIKDVKDLNNFLTNFIKKLDCYNNQKNGTTIKIEIGIEGFADSVGRTTTNGQEQNMKISTNRAIAVEKHIKSFFNETKYKDVVRTTPQGFGYVEKVNKRVCIIRYETFIIRSK